MSAAWALAWRIALRRRRLLVLNVLVPLVLVGPVALADAPTQHAAAVYAVLFVTFATFGAAIPWVRDGESGWLERLALRGLPPAALVLGRTAAAAALDFLQLAPAAVLIAGVSRAGPAQVAALAGALAVALALANLLGCWVAALARSVAEAALFGAVSALLLLHGAGTFRTPVPGSLGAAVEGWIPFRLLHESLLAVAGGGPPPGPVLWGTGVAVTLLAAGITVLGAPWMVARLTRPEG